MTDLHDHALLVLLLSLATVICLRFVLPVFPARIVIRRALLCSLLDASR